MLYTLDSIAPIAQNLHNSGQKTVLATGFFDLLHEEHINFLHKAKKAGDALIVAVESDVRARSLKGEGRPIQTQRVRCQIILEQKLADYVIELGDDFNNVVAYERLMSTIKPDIYAVSSHTNYLELKQKLTAKYGGTLTIVHDWNPSISTTKQLQST